MGDGASLSAAFLDAAAQCTASEGERRALDEALASALTNARAAWPELSVPDDAFVRYLAARAPAGDAQAGLAELQAADLYLACACSRGDVQAAELLAQRLLGQLGAYVAHLDGSAAFADDVRQLLLEKLLAPHGKSGEPKILEYSGRGALGGWLRVAAVRTAVDWRRHLNAQSHRDDHPKARDLLTPDDPELRAIKERYRDDFESALETAMRALTIEERHVLRLHFVDGLSMEQIGALERVNRSTVWRRLGAAQAHLLEETQRELKARLRLSPSEFDSLAALVQSQLELSLSRLLAK
jgi:RNA polymerase sigma-70 factor (ECF subfamily)